MHLSRFMPRWRVALYSAAIGLPLVAVAVTALMILLDSSGQVPRHSITSQFLDLPKYIAAFNWPYVVLDIVTTVRLRHVQAPGSGQPAAMGAVIGMTIPYALAYSFWPFEMSSSHNDAGQGVGILLILLGWVIGTIGAVVGWALGRRLEKPHHRQE
jgi:hypothetical protein